MNGNFKRKLSAFAAMLALVSITSTAMAVDGGANIQGYTPNVQFKQNGNEITQMSFKTKADNQIGQVDFKTFNLAKGHKLDYGFTGKYQTMINRVLGGNESQINGKITSSGVGKDTGRVLLINPAGVMFGQGSSVNLNNFDVSTSDFKGAKNLKDMMSADGTYDYDSEMVKYTVKLNSNVEGINPIYVLTGPTDGFNVQIDKTHTEALDAALKANGIEKGIEAFKGAAISFNGTNFAIGNDLTVTADKISYTDSQIKAGGNVKLVTADGQNFGIQMNNSGLAKDVAAIEAKNVDMTGGSFDIKNTYVKADTATYNSNGDIIIGNSELSAVNKLAVNASNDTLIDNSTLTSSGDMVEINSGNDTNVVKSTLKAKNTVKLASSKNSTVDNSTLTSTGNQVRVSSKNDTKINNSTLTSKNAIAMSGNNTTSVTSSKLTSTNTQIKVVGNNGLKFDNSTVNAKSIITAESKNADVTVTNSSNFAANTINVNASSGKAGILASKLDATGTDSQINVNAKDVTIKSKANLNAEGKVNVTASNDTLIDNSTLTSSGDMVEINSGNDINVAKSTLKANKNVNLTSTKNISINNSNLKSETNQIIAKSSDAKINGSTLASKNATLISGKNTVNVDGSKLTSSNTQVKLTGNNDVILNNSTVNAKTIATVESKKVNATINNSSINAGEINHTAAKAATVDTSNLTVTGANSSINIQGADVTIQGTAAKANITAEGDVNVAATNNNNIIASNVKGGNINVTGKDINIKSNRLGKSSLNAANNIKVKATNNTEILNSTLTANKNISVAASNTVNLKTDTTKVTTTLTSKEGYVAVSAAKGVKIDKSNINAKNGTASARSAKGDVSITNQSNITAKNAKFSGSFSKTADSKINANVIFE